LARALDLHSRGQGFDSLILHERLKSRKKTTKKWRVHSNSEQKIMLVHENDKVRFLNYLHKLKQATVSVL